MKTIEIHSQMELLALKKAKIERKEKLLKLQERKAHTKKLIELGSLIYKSHLENLSVMALTGALLEIKEKSQDPNIMKEWEKKAKEAAEIKKSNGPSRLIISLKSHPSTGEKALLRELQFKWNAFRKEWHGYGKLEDIEPLLKNRMENVEILEIPD